MILHVLFSFLLSSLLLFQNEVVARNRNLSKIEDLKLERQLKRLNKPAIKTIHTEHGDIYDCIDFYQQPAFDHPRLKNHTYHFEEKNVFGKNETRDPILSEFIKNFGLKDEKCPIGTVLIKRVTKDDLIRERLVSNRKSPTTNQNSFIHTAVVRTLFTLDKYTGASGSIGIYNPPVKGKQYSASMLKVQRGIDIIEVGWRVDPSLYNDEHSHIFVHTDATESGSHCFGITCPGFVVTSKELSINAYFKDAVSYQGVDTYYFPVDISRDQETGNWKLRVGPKDGIELGYWPKEIFSEDGLAEYYASYIEWGAEVYCPPEDPNTIMGYGNIPNEDTHQTASIKNIAYKDLYYQKKDAVETEPYSDDEKYKIIDLQSEDYYFGRVSFYGGPILKK